MPKKEEKCKIWQKIVASFLQKKTAFSMRYGWLALWLVSSVVG